jgi:hypothetical protein
MLNGAQRTALGQSAQLGSLYDARSDSFIGVSLLNDAPPTSAVTVTDNHTSEVTLSASDSYDEKLRRMDMDAELSASFLSGMVDVGGSGRYLTEKRESNRILQASLHYNVTTVHENLNFMSNDLQSYLAVGTLQSGAATHVVVGIAWGAKSVVTARHRLSTTEDRSEIEGQFQAEFGKFTSMIEVAGDASIELETGKSSKQVSFEVSVHGDVLANDSLIPTDFPSAYRFISNIPKYILSANGGKGKPLTYTLLPLGLLTYLLRVEISADIAIKQLSIECLERFVQLFDDIRDAQRKLNDYMSDIKKHTFCIPHEHIKTVARRYNTARVVESTLKSNYARLLKDVRSGHSGADQLWSLLKESSSGDTSPEQLSLVTNEYRSTMDFADAFIAKGAIYLGFDSKSLSAVLVNSNHDDAYVFFLDKKSMSESSSWEGNNRLLMELLTDPRRHCPVVLVDCDATKEPLAKAHISHFRNGSIIVEDMLEQAQLMADKCFARYDESLLDNSGVLKPLQRTLVQIPCPGRHCAPNSQCYDWICFRCHQPIEWGYADRFMYCDCGRCLVQNYEFKCKERNHGSRFERYNTQKLVKVLDALQPFPEVNILILGETGVGKSTFINAFINYLMFESLDEAMSDDKLNWVIPCSFDMSHVDKSDPKERFIQETVCVGEHNKDERDGSAGKSATQKPSVYPVPLGNTIVRLIDTPGVGDTEGVEKDRENMANILATLKFFPKLHGILILLKPNDSRLTVMFRFCINELLTHLHRDAAMNMVFGFTNTRISNYTPGDTFKPLESLLKKHGDVDLSLSRHTVYCFDSESFRFLAADKQGVKMDNIDDFRRSWQHSEGETRRLIQHFSSLPPHLVRSTLSLNRARQLIHRLTQPMAEITQMIETTIRVNQDNLKALSQKRIEGDELMTRLDFQKMVLCANPLDKPRTVCSDSKCMEERDDGTGVRLKKYKTMCHRECYLDNIPEKVVGDPQLAGCAAFNSSQFCTTCGHHWMVHLHVTYETQEKMKTVRDPTVAAQLKANESEITIKQTAIDNIMRKLQEAQREHATIQDAAARFGLFLKKNAITPYNDAMLDYIDHQIKQEKEKVVLHDVSPKQLEGLIKRRQEYEERIDSIKRSIAAGTGEEVLDENGVEELVEELFQMKHWGQNLQDVQEVATAAEEAAYRERPYAVTRRKKNWVQPVKWAKAVAGTVSSVFTG